MSQGLTVNASYTWSNSISDAPEANTFDQGSVFIEDPINRNRDRGNRAINRPHSFTLASVWTPADKNIKNRIVRYLANNNQLTFLATVSFPPGTSRTRRRARYSTRQPWPAPARKQCPRGRSILAGIRSVPLRLSVRCRYSRTF